MMAEHGGQTGTDCRIAVWGASGHSAVVADAIRESGFEVAAFLVDRQFGEEDPHARPPRYFSDEGLKILVQAGIGRLAVGIGDNDARLLRAETALNCGFILPLIAHPSAVISKTSVVGDGVFVNAGAVLMANSTVSRIAIINSRAVIEHDCWIGEGAHVCPGVCMGGHVRVGAQSFIGVGAVLRDRVNVGAGSIIGAGSVVVSDVPPGVVVWGNPARVRREKR